MSRQALISVLDAFCKAFENRDRDGVMRLFVPESGVLVVTSEEPLLRGQEELRSFLDRYAVGPTTYSWNWHRDDVLEAGQVAWLVAEGTETATTGTSAASRTRARARWK